MATDYPSRYLGSLPVDAINRVLGTELEPGNVWLSAQAHRHMAEDHPEDYPTCIATLELAISNPTFAGQAPKTRDNFEIVRRILKPEGYAVLVAIGLVIDKNGLYRVRSSYLIKSEKVDTRRQAGHLRPVMLAP